MHLSKTFFNERSCFLNAGLHTQTTRKFVCLFVCLFNFRFRKHEDSSLFLKTGIDEKKTFLIPRALENMKFHDSGLSRFNNKKPHYLSIMGFWFCDIAFRGIFLSSILKASRCGLPPDHR